MGSWIITRLSAKQAGEPSKDSEVVRLTRREIASVVKASGVIKPVRGSKRPGERIQCSFGGRCSRYIINIFDIIQLCCYI